MAEFRYARGRIVDSVRYLLTNILTALIEVCGAFLTNEGIAAENYGDALRKAGGVLGLTEQEQDDLAALAAQRNRLAHRYLNFRWQTIRAFSDRRELIARVAGLLLRKAEE